MATVEQRGATGIPRRIRPNDDGSVNWATASGGRADGGKPQINMVPFELIQGVAGVLEFGAAKYCKDNWKKGMDWTRCWDSAQRHMWAWQNGEDFDPESGKSHLAHAASNIAFLMWYAENRPEFDDRTPKSTMSPYLDTERSNG